MEAEEHFYYDDPKVGHPDVKTDLKDVNYYFLGNGLITAVVQVCTSGEGTPLGLLVMNPEKFGPKRNSISLNLETGLEKTMIKIEGPDFSILPKESTIESYWEEIENIPTVFVKWGDSQIEVAEQFFCPDRENPKVLRKVQIKNRSENNVTIQAKTGVQKKELNKTLEIPSTKSKEIILEYSITGTKEDQTISIKKLPEITIQETAKKYWQKTSTCQYDSDILNHLFNSAKYQLQANISQDGIQDASIWQYNLEWVRDQSMVLIGLVLSGQFELAKTMLDRIFTKFVTDDGDTVDSSQVRPHEEVELDQNGELILALRFYVDWTGDLSILKKHWEKVKATANFPLKKVFRHPETFLFHNIREYWERHALHGITDGMELMYQFYVSFGLESAAYLANLLDKKDDAIKWKKAAQEIREAMLNDPKYALIEDGHFIKRRQVDGNIQVEAIIEKDSNLPQGVPLTLDYKHYLNPDSSSVLPIAWEYIDPKSELAVKTLEDVEQLWNQTWDYGGYSRYNVTSEADSPGPWPFGSLFITRAYFENGNDEKVWRMINWLSEIPGSKSGATFEFCGEKYPVPPCPQVGIVPWNQAEILILFFHHFLGIRLTQNKLKIRPRLLKGLKEGHAKIRFRDVWIELVIEKREDKTKPGFWVENQFYPYKENGIEICIPNKDLQVKVVLPD